MSPEALEATFTKLSLSYGRDFLSRYEGLDLRLVKEDWRIELGGLSDRQVRYALTNLPPRAPNVFEFRQIALRAPEVRRAALPPPAGVPPAIVKARIAQLKDMFKKGGS